jgi:lipid-A-disaccharide synthase
VSAISRPRIFIVAGEPSGDVLGARLMAALADETGGRVEFTGVGGERMTAAGLRSLFPTDDLAVMGFAEVIPRLRIILRRLRETTDAVLNSAPDIVVTIDSPGFTLRLARRLRTRGATMPLVHYVAPQLWAWHPGRARKLAGLFDDILAVLPFEPEFFRGMGVATTYVGHPAIEEARAPAEGAARTRGRIAVLPGSRRGIVERLIPIYGEAIAMIRGMADHPISLVLPVVAATHEMVDRAARSWGVAYDVVIQPDAKRAALAACEVAITNSGTAALELALADVPMVVAYRVNAWTAAIARRVINVRHVALPNLIVGCDVIPELLQENCTPRRLADGIVALMRDPTRSEAQRAGFAAMRAALGVDGAPPSQRAARAVLGALAKRQR